DPLRVDSLRNVALHSRDARPRLDVPAQVAQRIANTPVLATTAPGKEKFKPDWNAMRVEQLSARAKNQELKVSDRRAATASQAPPQPKAPQPNIATEQAREKQMADLNRQAARGDRNVRQQLLEMRKQQVTPAGPQRLPGATAQGERVNEQM